MQNRASTSQLLPNRNVLTKINPVVRKRSREKKVLVLPEWDEHTAQSYRLLVGPKIKDYIIPDLNTVSEIEAVEEEDQSEQKEKEKFFSKLTASRLKIPLQPLKTAEISYECLHFPDDILYNNVPPDKIKNFDLIGRSSKKKTKNIVRPTSKSLTFSRMSSSLLSPSFKNTTQLSSSRGERTEKIEMEEEEETIEIPRKIFDEEEESDEIDKNETVDNNHSNSPVSKRERYQNIIKLRTFFYVLRCWARYNINAKVKADFIVDVSNTQIKIHIFDGWHQYVKRVRKLRKIKNEYEIIQKEKIIKTSFNFWKTKSARTIRNVNVSNDVLLKVNRKILSTFFNEFRNVTFSKRICRFETNRNFRYKPEGPFTPINHYYEAKRANNIKSMHFYFKRKIPQILRTWTKIVGRAKKDIEHTEQIHFIRRRSYFIRFCAIYRTYFHHKTLEGVRRKAQDSLLSFDKNEKEAADNVEKTVMMQLVRDKNVLKAKLNQFDRLSQNHHEAVMRRLQMRQDINLTVNKFFKNQEEVSLASHFKEAEEAARKTYEIRIQLAEGFVYHLNRLVRSYDNDNIAHRFCNCFRVLTQPIVEKAVGYLYEKRHLNIVLTEARNQRLVLRTIVKCSTLYHQMKGWSIWRKYIKNINNCRTPGLMEEIRRRVQIFQLYPYFNWTEILPVRPPIPLKQIEEMNKDLPPASLKRKIARERAHHINVKLLLQKHRLLRDFIRAYAAYVQSQYAIRSVIKLFRKEQNLIALRRMYENLKINASHETGHTFSEPKQKRSETEIRIRSDITAWMKHFFRIRNQQSLIIEGLPLS